MSLIRSWIDCGEDANRKFKQSTNDKDEHEVDIEIELANSFVSMEASIEALLPNENCVERGWDAMHVWLCSNRQRVFFFRYVVEETVATQVSFARKKGALGLSEKREEPFSRKNAVFRRFDEDIFFSLRRAPSKMAASSCVLPASCSVEDGSWLHPSNRAGYQCEN